jgi:hypothetical protein
MSAIQNISLFIPHVYANISSTQIFDVFENLRIGIVKNVDLIPKQGSDGKPYNAAYIHFYEWCDNVAARNFQERVLDPKQEAKIVYDDPWHWIVLENKTRKRVPGERKVTIDLAAFDKPLTYAPEKPNNKLHLTGDIVPTNLSEVCSSVEEFLSPMGGCYIARPAAEQQRLDDIKEMEEYLDEMEMEMDLEGCADDVFIELANLKEENAAMAEKIAYLEQQVGYYMSIIYAERARE